MDEWESPSASFINNCSNDLQELPVFVYHSQFSSAHKNQ